MLIKLVTNFRTKWWLFHRSKCSSIRLVKNYLTKEWCYYLVTLLQTWMSHKKNKQKIKVVDTFLIPKHSSAFLCYNKKEVLLCLWYFIAHNETVVHFLIIYFSFDSMLLNKVWFEKRYICLFVSGGHNSKFERVLFFSFLYLVECSSTSSARIYLYHIQKKTILRCQRIGKPGIFRENCPILL